MKKLAFIAVLALCGMAATAACNDSAAPAASNEPAATLAETNAGVDSQTDADNSATAQKTTKDKVTVLTDDTLFRPGKKVKRLTILDFNATWCGPCKQFAPVFHQAAEKFGKTVDFISIDTDKNPQTAQAFGIQAIPTVIFLYPNGKTKKFVGTQDIMPAGRFEAIIHGEM